MSPKPLRWVGGVCCLGLFPKKNWLFFDPLWSSAYTLTSEEFLETRLVVFGAKWIMPTRLYGFWKFEEGTTVWCGGSIIDWWLIEHTQLPSSHHLADMVVLGLGAHPHWTLGQVEWHLADFKVSHTGTASISSSTLTCDVLALVVIVFWLTITIALNRMYVFPGD